MQEKKKRIVINFTGKRLRWIPDPHGGSTNWNAGGFEPPPFMKLPYLNKMPMG
jgi:hypothetical protein